MNIVVSEICVYPVKALAGHGPARVNAEPMGLAGDRRWVLVDAGGTFISQRTCPVLSRVQVNPSGADLELTAPGRPPLRLSPPDGRQRLTVRIWRDQVDAAAADPAAGRWFTELLGRECRLAWMDRKCHRPLSAPSGRPGEVVSFADGFPCLLISEASLADLNGRLAEAVPMNRFRPNLVVAGCAPFAEDHWSRLGIGGAVLRNAGPCARCAVTTVDQSAGESRAPEPLRTLATYRRTGSGVIFGVNLVVEQPGIIGRGDPVQPMA